MVVYGDKPPTGAKHKLYFTPVCCTGKGFTFPFQAQTTAKLRFACFFRHIPLCMRRVEYGLSHKKHSFYRENNFPYSCFLGRLPYGKSPLDYFAIVCGLGRLKPARCDSGLRYLQLQHTRYVCFKTALSHQHKRGRQGKHSLAHHACALYTNQPRGGVRIIWRYG